jgi:hypothetical protein
MSLRRAIAVVTMLWLTVVAAPTASADTPVGPARYVPCPGATGDATRYAGPAAPFLCHSAVVDPAGNVVILRQGRSDAGPSAFGMLHALIDHNVSDEVVERVVSSAFPLRAPRQRVRYIAEFRNGTADLMQVWVEADLTPSRDAPDSERFGVVTAYCKLPRSASPENKCPDWVNATI